jgi:hypothetical protein
MIFLTRVQVGASLLQWLQDCASDKREAKVKEHGDGTGEKSVDNREAALVEERNPNGKNHEVIKIYNI